MYADQLNPRFHFSLLIDFKHFQPEKIDLSLISTDDEGEAEADETALWLDSVAFTIQPSVLHTRKNKSSVSWPHLVLSLFMEITKSHIRPTITQPDVSISQVKRTITPLCSHLLDRPTHCPPALPISSLQMPQFPIILPTVSVSKVNRIKFPLRLYHLRRKGIIDLLTISPIP